MKQEGFRSFGFQFCAEVRKHPVLAKTFKAFCSMVADAQEAGDVGAVAGEILRRAMWYVYLGLTANGQKIGPAGDAARELFRRVGDSGDYSAEGANRLLLSLREGE